MANFAVVNTSNIVTNVIVVDNSVLKDENGNEVEQKGIDFLKNIYKNPNETYVQCSRYSYEGDRRLEAKIRGPFNSTNGVNGFRWNFPVVGAEWRPDIQKFINPKPYPSWQLDENHNWRAPVKSPTEEECWYGEGEFVSIVEARNYPINDPLIKYVDVVHPETGETLQCAVGRMPAVWNEELQQWRGLHTDGAMRVWNGTSWVPPIK